MRQSSAGSSASAFDMSASSEFPFEKVQAHEHLVELAVAHFVQHDATAPALVGQRRHVGFVVLVEAARNDGCKHTSISAFSICNFSSLLMTSNATGMVG